MLTTVLCMLASVIATSLYFILKNRRRTPRLEIPFNSLPPIDEALRLLAGVTGAAVHRGNKAELFENGPIFEAMLADIAKARNCIHLETFVWSRGEVERRFVDALGARARAGVRVSVLIDAIGGNEHDPAQLARLREAGAQVVRYCKPRWWNLRRLNHRTHRKLLILDGHIGYVFGHGFSDKWLGNAHDDHHWRDIGVRLEGPVVHSLQSVFLENWVEETRCVPVDDCYPELAPCGEVDAHVVSSASHDTLSSVSLLYTMAISCARREVLIQNPYFAPDPGIVDLFRSVVARGVEVHLMVPGRHTDSPFVRWASRSLYRGLLEAGVRLYEYDKTLCHQKIVVVDGQWSHIGSTNFDARSLALNEEVGVGLLHAETATALRQAFQRDLQYCHEITLEQWSRRKPLPAMLEWMAYQLHDQL